MSHSQLLTAALAMLRAYDGAAPDWWPGEIDDLRDAVVAELPDVVDDSDTFPFGAPCRIAPGVGGVVDDRNAEGCWHRRDASGNWTGAVLPDRKGPRWHRLTPGQSERDLRDHRLEVAFRG